MPFIQRFPTRDEEHRNVEQTFLRAARSRAPHLTDKIMNLILRMPFDRLLNASKKPHHVDIYVSLAIKRLINKSYGLPRAPPLHPDDNYELPTTFQVLVDHLYMKVSALEYNEVQRIVDLLVQVTPTCQELIDLLEQPRLLERRIEHVTGQHYANQLAVNEFSNLSIEPSASLTNDFDQLFERARVERHTEDLINLNVVDEETCSSQADTVRKIKILPDEAVDSISPEPSKPDSILLTIHDAADKSLQTPHLDKYLQMGGTLPTSLDSSQNFTNLATMSEPDFSSSSLSFVDTTVL